MGAWENNAEARAQAEEKGVKFTYETLDQLLADPNVEVVAIGDYYGARGGIALRALQAGKHVLVDKPLCICLEDAEAIAQEANQRGLAVGIMLDMPDQPMVATATDAIRSGVIGKVNNIIFEGQHPLMYGTRPGWYFEEGKHGGVINDIAIHGIDWCRFITGSDVEEVVGARCWNFYADKEPDFLDSAQFVVKMGNGAGVMADISYAAPDVQLFGLPSYWHFRVWGELGMLEFSLNLPDVILYAKGESGGRVLPAKPVEKTYLDSFLEALNNPADIAACTRENLATARQTLMIQKAAD